MEKYKFVAKLLIIMTFEIDGKHNTATVHTTQDRDSCEQEALDQIGQMVDHKAFAGDSDVSIMPDFHWGSGAVIGFTMPVKDRIVPNTIGVDIGCGMYATKIDTPDFDTSDKEILSQLDASIRQRVPTGFDVHSSSESDYHIVNEFPWHECKRKLVLFDSHTDFDLPDADDVYTDKYFNELCDKIGYDPMRAINSVGTLGGGNHFIELGTDSSGSVWSIIHSGSRGIGAQIAQYWQEQATRKTTTRKSIDDVPSDVRQYLGDDWKPRADKIRGDFSGDSIQETFDRVSQAIQEYGPSTADRNTDLDYLEGDEAVGYIIDMIFAQTYASVSRKLMAKSVTESFRSVLTNPDIEVTDAIESVHNYIDFEDATIRKGACRAQTGERLVVPFNMSDGTIIARGHGRSSWNNSSAHGAGRAMSRTAAENRFTDSDFEEQTSDVYMSERPLDEIPGAYKSAEQIEAALGESLTVIDRVEPFMSIKAQ